MTTSVNRQFRWGNGGCREQRQAAAASDTHYCVRSRAEPSADRVNIAPKGQPIRGAAEKKVVPSLTRLRQRRVHALHQVAGTMLSAESSPASHRRQQQCMVPPSPTPLAVHHHQRLLVAVDVPDHGVALAHRWPGRHGRGRRRRCRCHMSGERLLELMGGAQGELQASTTSKENGTGRDAAFSCGHAMHARALHAAVLWPNQPSLNGHSSAAVPIRPCGQRMLARARTHSPLSLDLSPTTIIIDTDLAGQRPTEEPACAVFPCTVG